MGSRLVALACVLVVGCGTATPSSGPGAASNAPLPTLSPPPIDLSAVPARLQVEAPKATAAWIGPGGGTLTATAADGTAYELAIPPYAVFQPTPITMTPVTSVDGLGLSGGLAGAVYLQPAGLELAVPATLRITTSRAAAPGTRLVGFDVPDGDAPTDLIPAVDAGSAITALVFHFSAPGAGYGTPADLAQINQAAIPTRLGALLTILLAAPVPWDLNTRNAFGLLIDFQWAGSPVATQGPAVGLRQVIIDTTTDAGLLQALKDWRTLIFVMNLWASSGDAAAAIAAGESYTGGVRPFHTTAYLDGQIQLALQFKRAINGNEALCNATKDLGALANMWFWAGIGARYAPAEANWPTEADGCAELVVATFNPASNLQAGGSDSLQLVYNLQFTDGTRVPADVDATLTGAGFTFATTGGATLTAAIAGGTTFTTGVFAGQAPPYTLTSRACWNYHGILRELCNTESLTFGAGATQAPPPTGQSSGDNWGIEIEGVGASLPHCPQVTREDKGASVTLTETSLTGTWHYTPFCGINTTAVAGTMHATVVRNANGNLELHDWVLEITSASVQTCVTSGFPLHMPVSEIRFNSAGNLAVITPSLDGCPAQIQLTVSVGEGLLGRP